MPGLVQLVEELQLQESIEFTGPVFGEAKTKLLQTSSGFILPSFSEGLPMTVLEAWAAYLPVIMTEMCNLPEGFAASAAIKVFPTPPDIARGLLDFLALPEAARHQLGRNGRSLVERDFTWDAVSDQLTEVYRWLSGATAKPDCVYTTNNTHESRS